MIHISPCGWYCFTIQDESHWKIRDTSEKTLLTPQSQNCTIELLSARKLFRTSAEEVSQFHEQYLVEESIVPSKTTYSENSFQIQFYVTRGTGPDNTLQIIGHAFWNNYCVFLQYSGKNHHPKNEEIQVFYDILNSLQPLIDS